MKLIQKIDYQVFNDKVVKCTIKCKVKFFGLVPDTEFEVYGKATCKEPDVFDLITGKRLAETKALLKLHSRVIAYIKPWTESVNNYADKLTTVTNLEIHRFNHEFDHLYDLLGKDETND